jgi:hypothetical protein
MSKLNIGKIDCMFNENCHMCLLRKKRYLSYIRKRRETDVKKTGFFALLSSCTIPWNIVFNKNSDQ